MTPPPPSFSLTVDVLLFAISRHLFSRFIVDDVTAAGAVLVECEREFRRCWSCWTVVFFFSVSVAVKFPFFFSCGSVSSHYSHALSQ